LWQQFQILQRGVGHLAGEGGTIHLQFVALVVGDAKGPAAAQRRVVQPLVVRLDHGENPVYCAVSHRQLELSQHDGKAANLFDQRLGRSRPKRHVERDHCRAQQPPEFGDVPNRLLGNGF
jgi:hypothetical protein